MNQNKKYILQVTIVALMLNITMPAQAIDWSYWSNCAQGKISEFIASSKNRVIDCLQQPEVLARALVSAAALVITTYYMSGDKAEQSDDDSNSSPLVGDSSVEQPGDDSDSLLIGDSGDEYGAGIDDLPPYNDFLENKVNEILTSPLPNQGNVSEALSLIDQYQRELNMYKNEVPNATPLLRELALRKARIHQREEEAANREIASRDKIEHFLTSRFLSNGYQFEHAAVDLYLQKGDFSDAEGQLLLTKLKLRKLDVRLRCEDVYYRERESLQAKRKNLQAELVAMELQHRFDSKEAEKQEA